MMGVGVFWETMCDAPLNSLKKLNVNSKMKTTKEDKVGVCSLGRNTSRVKRAC